MIPAAIADSRRWIDWRYGEPAANGKRPKVPVSPRSGQPVNHGNPKHHLSLPEAIEAAARVGANGVGYSLDPVGDVVAVDLDHCRDATDGSLTPEAAGVLDDLTGTYAEVSPSGTGIRMFARGRLDPGYRCRGTGMELYPLNRPQFVSVTGHHLPDRAGLLADHTQALLSHQRSLGRRATARPAEAIDARIGGGVIGSDAELLAKAFAAANGEAIRRRWDGDWPARWSASEVLLSLANQLAFWSGPSPGRLFELLTGSPLVAATEAKRSKWYDRRPGGPWGLVHVAAPATRDCRQFFGGLKPPAGEYKGTPPVEAFGCNANVGENKNRLYQSWGRVLAGDLAPGHEQASGAFSKTAALCWAMSVEHGGGDWWLSGQVVAGLVGCPERTVYSHLTRLVKGGILTVAEKGYRGKSTVYRWTGSSR